MTASRPPSYGTLRVHGAKLTHALGVLAQLEPLDSEGIELREEGETLLAAAQAGALNVDPTSEHVTWPLIEARVDALYESVVHGAGNYRERRTYSPTGLAAADAE